MTIEALCTLLEARALTEDCDLAREVTSGYVGDLLSWVMAHAPADTAWVTVQTHLNVIAVAALLDMAAVVVPDGIEMEADSISKAREEGIAVLSSPLCAYEICARMGRAGLPGGKK
nr:AraC family transcriptional regulator [Maliibacterium massiliense]